MIKNKNYNDIESYFYLSLIPRLHVKNISPLLDLFESPAELISEKGLKEISKLGPKGEKLQREITEVKKLYSFEQEWKRNVSQKIKLITFKSSDYPQALLETAAPPILLYKKGSLPLNQDNTLGVVGSRNASYYGRETAEHFSSDLSQNGITIVSGMAKGVDAAAHWGALKGKGKSIAVLGSGLDVIYPECNENLYWILVEDGAVISEYPLGTKPHAYNFPKRNRIIAGMTQGTLVVEASPRSGSLITSRIALDEGRDVYSIPGKVDYFGAKGNNRLIKEGARLVDSPSEILEDFKVKDQNSLSLSLKEEKDNSSLTPLEKRILSQLGKNPTPLNAIFSQNPESVSMLQSIITSLELKSMISKERGGNLVLC